MSVILCELDSRLFHAAGSKIKIPLSELCTWVLGYRHSLQSDSDIQRYMIRNIPTYLADHCFRHPPSSSAISRSFVAALSELVARATCICCWWLHRSEFTTWIFVSSSCEVRTVSTWFEKKTFVFTVFSQCNNVFVVYKLSFTYLLILINSPWDIAGIDQCDCECTSSFLATNRLLRKILVFGLNDCILTTRSCVCTTVCYARVWFEVIAE